MGGGNSWANPPVVALVAVLGMVFSGCMRFSDVRHSVDVQLLLTIACALGLGEAMQSSGAALMLANSVTGIVSSPFLLLLVVYLLTMLLTEMVSNNAVAAIMIPIGISIAIASGHSPRPFILAIALAASLAFVTPIGYQTNLMVMGPGGYRPLDYARCGFPLSLVVATTAIFLLKFLHGF
jgi:di/tricarboxylate transporter